jgi:hypothetical protein
MRRQNELQMLFNCSDLCRRIHGSMINLNLPQAYAWVYTLPPHSRFSKICFSFLCPDIGLEVIMKLHKQSKEHHENELRLTLDARKRISLAKLLPNYEICSFKAYNCSTPIIPVILQLTIDLEPEGGLHDGLA